MTDKTPTVPTRHHDMPNEPTTDRSSMNQGDSRFRTVAGRRYEVKDYGAGFDGQQHYLCACLTCLATFIGLKGDRACPACSRDAATAGLRTDSPEAAAQAAKVAPARPAAQAPAPEGIDDEARAELMSMMQYATGVADGYVGPYGKRTVGQLVVALDARLTAALARASAAERAMRECSLILCETHAIGYSAREGCPLCQRDSAQAALETTRLNLQAAVIAFSESQAALAEMREALRKYARHRASCELTDVSGEGPCICGLDAALRSPEARTQGEGT